MKKIFVLLMVIASVVLAQAPGSNKSTILLEADPPQPISSFSVTAQVSGTMGTRTLYYWVVARYPIGNAIPAGPALVRSAPDTMTVGNFVRVSWLGVNGATGYDILRTVTPTLPNGTCNCSIATAVTTTTVNNTSDVLGAYTVSAANKATSSISLLNQSFLNPVITLDKRTMINADGDLLYLNGSTHSYLQLYPKGLSNLGGSFGYQNASSDYFFLQNNRSGILLRNAGVADAVVIRPLTLKNPYNLVLALQDINGVDVNHYFYNGAQRFTGVAFAALGAPASGTQIYCSDCTQTLPCAGAGTGAWALRINGAWSCSSGAAAGGMAYDTIADTGVALVQRTTVNFTGAGVTCVDNGGLTRTDCTVAASAGAAFGTYAAKGAVCTQGSTYFVNDAPWLLYCDAGNVWRHTYKGMYYANVPDTTSFTCTGTGTISSATGGILVTGANNQTGNCEIAQVFARPYRIWGCFDGEPGNEAFGSISVNIKDTTTGKCYSIQYTFDGVNGVDVQRIRQTAVACDTFDSWASQQTRQNVPLADINSPVCFSIRDDNTDLIFEIGSDSTHWQYLFKEANNTFFATVPEAMSFSVNGSANRPPSVRFVSWGYQ